MSKNFKFVLNRQGVRELLQSSNMQSILVEKASNVASSAGSGYAFNFKVGKNRGIASVYADTYEARKDNNENNTLLKAIGS